MTTGAQCISRYEAAVKFLERNDLHSVIRAHEAQDAGYDSAKNREQPCCVLTFDQQICHVPQNADEEIPVCHHRILGTELSRCVPQSWGYTEVCQSKHYHPAVSRTAASVLAAELYGRVYVESSIRRRKEYVHLYNLFSLDLFY